MTPPSPPAEMTGLRLELHLKLRFGLARLPLFPALYRLQTPGEPDCHLLWTKVIPFMDPARGAFSRDLYGWDVRELRFLRRFLRPGMRFVDVGAHHGLYSIVAARGVGAAGAVAAFEPVPAVFRRLRWHLRLNRGGEVRARRRALGARRESARIHIPVRGIDTLGSLHPPGGGARFRAIAIEVEPLDDSEVASWPSLDLLKLDVEGAEGAVLDGAARALERLRPCCLFECLDWAWAGGAASGRALLERFRSLRCGLFEFDPEGRLFPHVPRERYPLQSNCNLLAVPEERMGALASLRSG